MAQLGGGAGWGVVIARTRVVGSTSAPGRESHFSA
jgi:hypothetical protein